jgi:type IV pilus assembly protein PilW
MNTPNFLRREAGMSLIELMVGAAIGLIGIVIITHIYLTNEQHKRATTAAGGAQTNGAIALFALEREIRQAGFGLNSSFAWQCNCDSTVNAGCSAIQYHYQGQYSFPPNGSIINARNSLSMYPLIITGFQGPGGNGPDTLSVFYGSDNERALSTQLIDNMLTPGADIKPDGSSGFEQGNLVVLQNGTTCAMYQVTNILAGALQHAANDWNPPGGGTLPTWAKDSTRVFNLGNRPVWRTFGVRYDATNTINYGKLMLTDQYRVLTEGAVSQDMMDGIVDLQAQYGKDTDGDGVVDLWTKLLPSGVGVNFTANDIMQVIAVRLAVLARDDHYYKPSTAGGPCEATTAANRPTWTGGAFLTFDAPGALPSCYKYRVFETVVPLRNMIWRPE